MSPGSEQEHVAHTKIPSRYPPTGSIGFFWHIGHILADSPLRQAFPIYYPKWVVACRVDDLTGDLQPDHLAFEFVPQSLRHAGEFPGCLPKIIAPDQIAFVDLFDRAKPLLSCNGCTCRETW